MVNKQSIHKSRWRTCSEWRAVHSTASPPCRGSCWRRHTDCLARHGPATWCTGTAPPEREREREGVDIHLCIIYLSTAYTISRNFGGFNECCFMLPWLIWAGFLWHVSKWGRLHRALTSLLWLPWLTTRSLRIQFTPSFTDFFSTSIWPYFCFVPKFGQYWLTLPCSVATLH